MFKIFGRQLIGIQGRKSSLIALVAAVLVSSVMLPMATIKTVAIFDGDQRYSVKTIASDTEVILATADISCHAEDTVTLLNADSPTPTLLIDRAHEVTVTVGDDSCVVRMQSGTVADAIRLAGFSLGQFDLVNMDLNSNITDDAYIDILRVSYSTTVEQEKIPYTVSTTYSASVAKGEVYVASKGQQGLKSVTYNVKYVNGVAEKLDVASEKVITAATTEKRYIGTKIGSTTKSPTGWISALAPSQPIIIDENGVPTSYSKVLKGNATAYCKQGTTATGVKSQPGYIAVNPKIIPYGTRVYIKSSDGKYIYGYAIAADTGGFARNNSAIADLFFTSYDDCINFGRRNIEIYVLD